MHGMMEEHGPISSSYNGRRAVSETDNEGPIPSLEALKRAGTDGI